ncbi:PREDICTED: uncharacterized protein LOC109470901 [Branchiostoma belcheri]|uniref:Uncharacterized protein LOC109470901 n=1 Tax=Branchiostoma belcheri TaxID=7741 RepID=A0A6P4Z7E8_BRABE|nr:PREDICTED: uncharacterized protein LOC109470901 [Branchiostoma belcheri]
MKWTGCCVLVICFVFGIVSSTLDHPPNLQAPECLFRAWDACMIKIRDHFYLKDYNKTCTICERHDGDSAHINFTAAPLSKYVPFPAAQWQWIALRGVHVGKLSSQTLEIFNPPSLVILALIDAGIRTIDSEAFAKCPHLESVHLDYNMLPELKRAWFTGFHRSHKFNVDLSFSNNRIATLECGCFEEIEYLKVLDLSRNLLSEVSSEWFRGLSFLNTLVLSYNKIEVISESAFDSLPALLVLNLTENPLVCVGKRTLRGPTVITVGGRRRFLSEQDKMDWSLTVDKTNFPWRKQEVRFLLHNLQFCLTYHGANAFDLRWGFVDTVKSDKAEPGCESTLFGPLKIRAPFVIAKTALETQEKGNGTTSYDMCPAAWGRQDGISVALEGGATLQLVGLPGEPKLLKNNGSTALVCNAEQTLVSKKSKLGATTGHINRVSTGMMNISCFVFHRNGTMLEPNIFKDVQGEVDSKCPAKDTLNVELTPTATPPYYQIAGSATENVTMLANLANEDVENLTMSHLDQLATCVVNPKYRGSDLVLARPPHANGGDETVSVHEYSEIKDEEVNDACVIHNYSEIKDEDSCVTHNYSEIKDEDVGDDENEENIEVNRENQNGHQCSERDDVVRCDCQETEDPNDDVVTFYAAAAELTLPPATLEGDARQHYNTTQGNTKISHVLYSAAELE